MPLPIGRAVDDAPRSLPARAKLAGQHVVLEPLHTRHVPDLWVSARAPEAEDDWTYMSYGPFTSEADMVRQIGLMATQHDPMMWAVRSIGSGRACGWLALMDIQPQNAAIELGNIWFSPALRRMPAATEAMFMLARLALEDLGYRRLVWKCNSLNMASRRAAERLGFQLEGVLHSHLIVKGRNRDTAMYAMLADAWPSHAAAILAWLQPSNFEPNGGQRQNLASYRACRSEPDL